MSETPRTWKYLERRSGSSYQQLCIKGKRIWAWTLYCDSMNAKEPRTPQQLADMVVFTASPRGKTISGQALSVCGDTNMLG